MSKKITKAAVTKATKLFNDLVVELGIKPNTDPRLVFGKPYYLNTKYGILGINPDFDKDSCLLSVFTCFEHPKLLPQDIIQSLKINPYSGKMNFYESDPETCINVLRYSLNKVI